LKLVVLKWQVEHSPEATCALPSALVAGRSTVGGAPIQLLPFSWQLEQVAALTALCTMAGGAVPLAFANMNDPKVELEWQLSQAAVPKGM